MIPLLYGGSAAREREREREEELRRIVSKQKLVTI